ncbi:MAG: helix-turn-helix domain-containing protein, partial [Solirubrobacteraceae bacterium]|nr:helix-turn-helix domain-containing protein [Solirubrobacteraceae bacterium]
MTTDLGALASEARGARADLAQAAVDRASQELSLDPATRRNLEVGTLAAVDAMLSLLGDPAHEVDVALFRAHGGAHCAAGRPVTELLALYRLSGMGMWEHLSDLPRSDELTGAQALALGGRVLRLIDVLSASAVDGFLAAGADLRRRDRARRDRLRTLLLSDPPEPLAAIEAAAEPAGWAVPARVRVGVVAQPLEADLSDQERAPARVLVGPHLRGRIVMIVGEADDAGAMLRRAANAHGAPGPVAVGPSVDVAEAARSAQRAADLLDQIQRGAVESSDVVFSDDHELPLLLAAAPELARSLVDRRLAPLAELEGAKREQALETLRAWLANPHRPQAIADDLGMHVQSVRYRLARLREL